jgi:hypothetical protein
LVAGAQHAALSRLVSVLMTDVFSLFPFMGAIKPARQPVDGEFLSGVFMPFFDPGNGFYEVKGRPQPINGQTSLTLRKAAARLASALSAPRFGGFFISFKHVFHIQYH